MNKHLKGPWKTSVVDDTLIVGAGESAIAMTLGEYSTESEAMEANARLIAAAPDLVAALEPFGEFARMMDEIEHVKTTPDDAVIHPGLTVGHFRRAREVVAKAKGEA